MVIFLMTRVSQKILIVQKFGVLASLPEAVETEIKVELNHLFAWRERDSVSKFSEGNQPGNTDNSSTWKTNYSCWFNTLMTVIHSYFKLTHN